MQKRYNKILFVRTDRMGDVLVSTPALRSLRRAYPQAWISMMVAPAAYQAVELNPDINEVLVYDKRANGWRLLQFLRVLRSRKFDIAVIAHCTNPVNWMIFLAGIPERIGYARRAGFLLSRPLPNIKVLGEKHEADYTLDLVKLVGGVSVERTCVFRFDEGDREFARTMLRKMGSSEKRPIVAVHAGTTSPSKRWPEEYFSKLMERLVRQAGVRVILIGGTNEMERSYGIIPRGLEKRVVDFTGLLTLRETGAMLSLSTLLISNDSGPVHLAEAVGTPVVAIFGRNRHGLGPVSWGPLGPYDRVVQKDVGCTDCQADHCPIQFKCLKELSVDDVYRVLSEQLDKVASLRPSTPAHFA